MFKGKITDVDVWMGGCVDLHSEIMHRGNRVKLTRNA